MFTNFLEKESRLKVAVYLVVFVISLADAINQDPSVETSSLFKRTMIDLFGSVQNSIFELKSGIGNFVGNYFYLVEVKKRSNFLEQEISQLKNKIFQLEELRKENKRLKDLLKFGEELEYKKILARVISWDANRAIRTIRINRGTENGVKLELPVVANEGLVGYVYRVSDHFSDIMTILNQNNRADGIVTRTRSHGIIEGYSDGKCIMKYVTRSEPVILNDQIVTSGLGGIYPKGLKIGKISNIERESYGITQFVEVNPSVDFSKLEEVIVLQPEISPEES